MSSIIYTKNDIVRCSGDEQIPHPLVYLNLSAKGKAECPYCGQKFILNKDIR